MGTVKTMLHTQRLYIKKWTQADADSLLNMQAARRWAVAGLACIKARRKAEM